MTARSELDCAHRCSSDPNCKTFTFTKGSPTGTCRLHPHVMTSQSPRSAAPGARSYTVKTEEGLETLHTTTSSGNWALRIDLGNLEGNMAYATYTGFYITNCTDKYRLMFDLGCFRIQSACISGDSLSYSRNQSFSTHDADHDTWHFNCAVDRHGAWWFRNCGYAHLNGEYMPNSTATSEKGVYCELRAEMVTMRELLEKKDRQILHLQDRVDELEQYSRRNNIRISDIPETDGEDTDDLIIAIGNEIGVTITEEMIHRSHRVGKKGDDFCRPIICKFTSYRYKQRLFKEKKKLANVDAKQLFPERSWRRRRTSQRPSYTTRAEPKIKIYLNDDLTKTRAEIASKARKMKSDGALQDTWVRDGTVRPIELRLHVS
nr:hypothetical protein BaRGS_014987 [Batillaria attramentaria]